MTRVPPEPRARITERQQEVLALIAEGQSTKELAFTLGITFKTAACHRYRLMTNLAAHNTAELLRNAARAGLLDATITQVDDPAGMLHAVPGDCGAVLEAARRTRMALRDALDESASLRFESQEVRRNLKEAREQHHAAVLELMATCAIVPKMRRSTKSR